MIYAGLQYWRVQNYISLELGICVNNVWFIILGYLKTPQTPLCFVFWPPSVRLLTCHTVSFHVCVYYSSVPVFG